MDKTDKDILRLAAPAIINNITVPLLGLCDTAIAGHLRGAVTLGAVTVGTMMLNVIFWLFGFLRMGTSGLTAQYYGRRDGAACRDILKKVISLACAIGIIILALQTVLRGLLLELISPGEDVKALAANYYDICIWSVPAQLAVMGVSGWFVGMQNTVIPMAISIGINILNIALSFTLSLGLGTGFSGIAAGTAAATWVGAVVSLILAIRFARHHGALSDTGGMSHRISWRRLLGVNGDLMFRSGCVMCVSLSMTAIGARLGDMTLAVNAVMMQFFILFSYFMDGFAFSGEALTGKYAGNGDRKMVKLTAHHLLRWGMAMAVVFFISYLAGYIPITRILTDDASVIARISQYRVLVWILPVVTVFAFIYDGIYIGLTLTRRMAVYTALSALCFFAVISIAGNRTDNTLLWISFEIYLLMRGAFLALDFRIREGRIMKNTKADN